MMNPQKLAALAKQKEAAINKMIPILMSIGKSTELQLSDAEQANHIFDVLQHMVAGCIIQVAGSYDQVAAISDQAAKDAKKLALSMYGEFADKKSKPAVVKPAAVVRR